MSESRSLEKWYPSDHIIRARINFWLHWNHTNSRVGTKKLLVSTLFPPKSGAEEVQKAATKAFEKAVTFVDKHLEQCSYLAGTEGPTIADLLLVTEFDQHLPAAFGLFDYGPYTHLSAWMKRMSEIPTYDHVFKPVCDIALKYRPKV